MVIVCWWKIHVIHPLAPLPGMETSAYGTDRDLQLQTAGEYPASGIFFHHVRDQYCRRRSGVMVTLNRIAAHLFGHIKLCEGFGTLDYQIEAKPAAKLKSASRYLR